MVKTFGGTSAVLVAMEVEEGEIFAPKNLDKLNRVQTAVKNIRGVVPFRIYSIVSPKFAHVDAGFDEFGVPEIHAEGFEELYAKITTGDEAAMQRHRTAIVEDPDLFGSIVSRDLKGTVLIANFWSEKDYRDIYAALQAILAAEEDANTHFYLAGRPILLGQIEAQFGRISLLFGLAVLAMVSLLYIDFRLVRAVLLALSAGLMADIWGMGFATLLGFEMDVKASSRATWNIVRSMPGRRDWGGALPATCWRTIMCDAPAHATRCSSTLPFPTAGTSVRSISSTIRLTGGKASPAASPGPTNGFSSQSSCWRTPGVRPKTA